MNEAFEEIKSCRICGGQVFKSVLNLGLIHVNAFPLPSEPDTPKAPLEVIQCNQCTSVQLRHTTNPDLLWKGEYWYSSSTASSMRSALKVISTEVMRRVQLGPEDVLLDVGANDAFYLSCFPDWVKKIAVEPNDLAKNIQLPNCQVINDYFTLKNNDIAALEGKVKVLSTIAMLYDVHDLREFIRAVDYVLTDDGTWVIQIAYLPEILKNNAYDGVCSEHIHYFALKPLRRLLREYGFEVYDAERVAVNEGSVRLWVQKRKANPGRKPSTSVKKLLVLEASLPRRLATWQGRVDTAKERLQTLVRRELEQGHVIALLGASTKANTLLQYCGLTRKEIAFASERQSKKHGRETVGSRIPIVSEDEARKRRPDVFIVGPWHFRRQMIEVEKDYLDNGGRLCFPLPKLDVVKRD